MKTSEMINEISKAMAIAQGEMRPASKSTLNPFFKSKYSTLAQVWEVIREPMTKNNLTILQDVSSTDQGISISTRICHASGQWIEFGPLEIPLNKRDAQSVGSATSYGKRYALSAAIGVVSEEDDDGEAAMGRKDEKRNIQTQNNSQFTDVSKMVSDNPKMIEKHQWTELNQLIDKCALPFQEKIWDRLAALGINSMAELDEETFVKMRDACLGNIAKQSKKETENAAG